MYWQIIALCRRVVCRVYCCSMLCYSVFVLGGGTSNLWCGGGGPSYVCCVSPGDLLVWGYFDNYFWEFGVPGE